MKVEGWLFAGGFVFFALVRGRLRRAVRREPAGTVALAFTAGLAFLVGYYLLFTGPAHRPPPGGRRRRRDRRRRRRAGLLQPAQLVAARGGRLAAIAFLGVVFGWWLFIIGAIGGGARRDRAGLRVLPGRARPLRPLEVEAPQGFRPTPAPADSLSTVTARNWTGAGQPVRLVGRLPRRERRARRRTCGGSGRPDGREAQRATRLAPGCWPPSLQRLACAGRRLHVARAAQRRRRPRPPSKRTAPPPPARASR